MSETIVELDRSKSATAGAVGLNDGLIAAGRTVYNLGQGREQQDVPLDIQAAYGFAFVSYVVKYIRNMVPDFLSRGADILLGEEKFTPFPVSTKYNSDHGGDKEVRTVAAGWLNRFFGLEGDAGNTFVFQQLGRAVLKEAASTFRKVNCKADANDMVRRPLVLLPDSMWPMLSETMADFTPVEYDVNEDDQCDNMIEALFTALEPDPSREVLFYLNFPHNPTGRTMTPDELDRFITAIEKENEQRKSFGWAPITLALDTPYFHANPEAANDNDSLLQLGYERLKRNGSVPYFMIASGSKAFGTATPGLSFASLHDSLVKPFTAGITASIGGAYVPAFFEGVKKAFSKQYDASWLGHFRSIRTKYEQNRSYLVDAFKSVAGASIAHGNPGMTSLIELDEETFLNRQVTGKLKTWDIRTVNDLVEYLANEHSVVVVNNSSAKGSFLRVAQATTLDKGFRNGVDGLVAGLNTVAPAPRLAA